MTAILIVLVLVCAAGWFRYWLGCASLALFIAGKECTLPTDEELEACKEEVLKRILRGDF